MLQRMVRFGTAVLIAFVMLLMFGARATANGTAAQTPRVENGQVDLTHWDFDNSGNVQLLGTWDFYWLQLLGPDDFVKENRQRQAVAIELPNTWESLVIDGRRIGAEGYATYRAIVKLPPREGSYALRIPLVDTSYKIWINGRLVHEEGKVGTGPSDVVRSTEPIHIPFVSGPQGTEIIIQAANYGYRWGGVWGSPLIGTAQQVYRQQVVSVGWEMFLFGSLFIIGVYHICLFALRRRDRSPLYLGLFCFVIGCRILVSNEMTIYYFFPHISWTMRMRIEYYTVYGAASLFMLYISCLFPKEINRRALQAVLAASVLAAALTLSGSFFFSGWIKYFEMSMIAAGAYLNWAIFLAVKRTRPSARLVLAGMLILYAALLFDITYAMGANLFGYIFPIGLLLFIFIQSVILSMQSNLAYNKTEEYAAQLSLLNATLEDKVKERTEELVQSQTRLEEANSTLQALSNQDVLTSLYNRRYLDQALHREWERAAEEGRPIAAIVADIDYFKDYNDHEGHLAGDECLKKVAAVLQSVLPDGGGIAARYGGEEFVLLLPSAQPAQVSSTAQLVLDRVAALKIPHRTSEAASYVTLSLGTAVLYPRKGQNPVELISKADEALYRAKRSGRNRTESA